MRKINKSEIGDTPQKKNENIVRHNKSAFLIYGKQNGTM